MLQNIHKVKFNKYCLFDVHAAASIISNKHSKKNKEINKKIKKRSVNKRKKKIIK